MPHVPWLIGVILAIIVGAWLGTKYPSINLIGKVTG